MDVLKLATEWAKNEVFSSKFFILFGLIFILASIGFWQLGKTDMAKAFIVPLLVTGGLLIVIGSGLIYSNQQRLKTFPLAHQSDASAFTASEIERAANTVNEYGNVFKVIPALMVICALLIFFVDKPIWRASCIAAIGMFVVIMTIDINAKARMEEYRQTLLESKK